MTDRLDAYVPAPVPREYSAEHIERELRELANYLAPSPAWAGLALSAPVALAPNSTVQPFQTNPFPDAQINSNLPAGSVSISEHEAGFYQVNIYFNFEAVSNGGTFVFTVYVNGAPSTLTTTVSLSNQSSVGNGVLVAFVPSDLQASGVWPRVLTLHLVSATKNITMQGCTWTLVRLHR